jgi:hypothetical protein
MLSPTPWGSGCLSWLRAWPSGGCRAPCPSPGRIPEPSAWCPITFWLRWASWPKRRRTASERSAHFPQAPLGSSEPTTAPAQSEPLATRPGAVRARGTTGSRVPTESPQSCGTLRARVRISDPGAHRNRPPGRTCSHGPALIGRRPRHRRPDHPPAPGPRRPAPGPRPPAPSACDPTQLVGTGR